MTKLVRLLILAAATAALTTNGLTAQPNPANPPISIKGWDYIAGPGQKHTFQCKPPICSTLTMVDYISFPPTSVLKFEEFRRQTESSTELMQKTFRDGTRVELLAVENKSKLVNNQILGIFKYRRVATIADGRKLFFVGGYVFGSHRSVHLESWTSSEKLADDSFKQFSAGLWLFANNKLER